MCRLCLKTLIYPSSLRCPNSLIYPNNLIYLSSLIPRNTQKYCLSILKYCLSILIPLKNQIDQNNLIHQTDLLLLL